MVKVTSETLIHAPQEKIAREIYRVEAFPEYMEDVKEVKILERTKERQVSAWKVDIDGVELNWVEEDCLVYHTNATFGHMYYRIIEGDFERFEGNWIFTQANGNAPLIRVELSVEYDLGLPQFEELIGEILEVKVKRNTASLLQALKERAEIS